MQKGYVKYNYLESFNHENMKAIIKNTKEVVEVTCVTNYNSRGEIINSWYHSTDGRSFLKDELEFIDLGENLDYWAHLEHQYAGMAMQGLLANQTYMKRLLDTSTSAQDARDIIVEASWYLAHDLAKKLKNTNIETKEQ